MHKNAIWIIFLLIVVAFSLWFVVKAGYDLIHYYQFSTQVPITVEKWEAGEIKTNQYAIQAHFSYEFDGQNYRGIGQIGEKYPNPWSAKKAIGKYEKQEWHVWINPKTPEQATLDKKFPYKGVVSAAVLIGLAAYFICLGLYVGVKNEQRRK